MNTHFKTCQITGPLLLAGIPIKYVVPHLPGEGLEILSELFPPPLPPAPRPASSRSQRAQPDLSQTPKGMSDRMPERKDVKIDAR